MKAAFNSPHELLIKALLEVSTIISNIGTVPAAHQADVLESTRQTVDYNVNKYLLKNPSQKEAVLKWAQELKLFLKPQTTADKDTKTIEKASSKASFVLEDSSRWTLKGHKGSEGEVVEPAEAVTLNQAVNVYDTQAAVVKISSKCKNALVENCRELGLIINSVVSGVEIVNSRKCQIQVEQSVPSVTIDSCDEITLFLTAEILKTVQIYTSKISQVNIKVLSPEGDLVHEYAVPEQFKSSFSSNGGKLETLPLAHAGV